MLAAERRRAIAELVAARPGTRSDELAERFAVSAETIRRDLLYLQRAGAVRRVHGGATPPGPPRAVEDSFVKRTGRNAGGKQAMARLAATLVRAGDTVVLDVGTSALEVARALPAEWHGRVLTGSLLAAAELTGRSGVEVYASGGRVRGGDLACSGDTARSFFADHYADIAFLGSGGVHAEAGLTDYHTDEVDVRRIIIDHSARNYVLADATKLGVVAVRRVCPLSALDGLITDGEPDAALTEALAEHDTETLRPGAPGPAERTARDVPQEDE